MQLRGLPRFLRPGSFYREARHISLRIWVGAGIQFSEGTLPYKGGFSRGILTALDTRAKIKLR
jgi:hypothetical protein